jgi:acyl-coenzyme A synthetase/AMP-(fatty) acid ligase
MNGAVTVTSRQMDLAEYFAVLDATEIGVHLPSTPEREVAIEACRLAGKTVVGLDAGPRVVVTADGVLEGGVVRCLKEEVDAAVPGAERVIVLRLIGDAPLAATLDAYLDVHMIDGRDVWVDEQ